jgi:hypothetical protein
MYSWFLKKSEAWIQHIDKISQVANMILNQPLLLFQSHCKMNGISFKEQYVTVFWRCSFSYVLLVDLSPRVWVHPTLISQISSSARIVGMLYPCHRRHRQRIGNKWMW